FNEAWLTQPLAWRRPRRIFVCAHGDLFYEDVPDAWIDRVFVVMAQAPQHTFIVLSKRSARMRRYLVEVRDKRPIMPGAFPWPLPNVWLGVSAEDQRRADERIPDLLATPAAVRFISAEPLLAPIDLRHIQAPRFVPEDHEIDWKFDALQTGDYYDFESGGFWTSGDGPHRDAAINWVIVGGESGPGARPMHPDWARSLRDQCAAAGVPFFFKQWGAWKDGSDFAPDAMAVLSDGRVVTPTRIGLLQADRTASMQGLNPTMMREVGKAAAGRLLDGVEHSAWPAP
ncbi:MAG TPA: phage Gp37/Gp68 family protein, partial [Vineibacter sp.]|nr:phage Gp37/Gp68 family protein [Vineibacter sp.]